MSTGDSNSKILNVILWIAQVVLSFMFLMAGFMKATSPIAELSVNVPWSKDIPEALVRFIGISEFSGALGLLLPSILRIKPILTPIAALALTTIMIFAMVFHFMRGEYQAINFNISLAIIAIFIAYGRLKKIPITPKS